MIGYIGIDGSMIVTSIQIAMITMIHSGMMHHKQGGDWEPGEVFFGAMLGSFEVQVGGLGGPSWRFWSLFGVYVGSCRAQMEFGRFRGYREGVGKGLGWLRGGWGPGSASNMDPT